MLTILRDTARGRDARPRRVYRTNVPNTREIEMPQLPTAAAHSGHGSRIASNLATTFNDSSSFEDAASRYVRRHLFMKRIEVHEDARTSWRQNILIPIRNFRDEPWAFTGLAFLSMLLLLVFVSLQIIAICSSFIILSPVGRSEHPYCGLWMPDVFGQNAHRMSNATIIAPIHNYHTDLTFKALNYVENCYQDNARPEECSYFYNDHIPFTETHNASCPFQDSVCLFNNQSALHLDTGFVDARALGINERHSCQFRIQKTCAPLSTNERYIKSQFIDDDGTKYVEYHYGDGYGKGNQGNKTFGEVVKSPWALAGIGRYLIRYLPTSWSIVSLFNTR